MKSILFSLLTIGIATKGFSQFDGNNSIAIPKIKSKEKAFAPKDKSDLNTVPKTPLVLDPLPANPNTETIFKKIGESKPISLYLSNEFKNPGDIYQQKLNKKDGEVSQVFRKNQNLGDFKTKSTFVSIYCRDNEFVDGDRVRIYINDILIQSDILLDGEFQQFEVSLKKGFNKIDIEAINQGSSGPNTAEFQVFDEKGGLLSQNRWNLATGYKATIVVIRE